MHDLILCGSIPIEDKIGVTDPCYGMDYSTPCLPGTYRIYTHVLNRRNTYILAVHDEVDLTKIPEFEEVRKVNVDSGMMSIGIFGYPFKEKYEQILDRFCFFDEEKMQYRHIDYTVMDDQAVIVHTAYGDGAYPVFVKRNDEGLVVGIWVDFL